VATPPPAFVPMTETWPLVRKLLME
jgi:hypothetical protein